MDEYQAPEVLADLYHIMRANDGKYGSPELVRQAFGAFVLDMTAEQVDEARRLLQLDRVANMMMSSALEGDDLIG